MASPTFSLTDILIRGRQSNSQVIVSGVPSRREKKNKDAWSQVKFTWAEIHTVIHVFGRQQCFSTACHVKNNIVEAISMTTSGIRKRSYLAMAAYKIEFL